MKTTYYKSHGSNQAESQTEADPTTGLCYTIHTYRNSRGVIQCEATECTDRGSGMIEYDLMGAKRIRLAEAEGKATENKIREVHEAGLKRWEALQAEQPTAPVYRIEIGQVFFSDGFEGASNRRAVYEVTRPGEFKTVTLDGKHTRRDDHVRKYGERQGIGIYYREGDKISPEQVNDLLNSATAAEAEERTKAQAASQAAQDERTRLIAEGSKLIASIPAGITHVIIAELHENTSDLMTDYHGHTCNDVVYLAWSNHGKDLFSEMRKAADKFEGTQHLGTGKGIYTLREIDEDHYRTGSEPIRLTNEAEAEKLCNEKNSPENRYPGHTWIIEVADIEHREKYSMGSGYYLKNGHSDSSGWAVSKSSVPSLEVLQIAAAQGKLLCSEASPDWYKAGQGAAAPVEAPKAGTVDIIVHPKRAGKILVIGDTYPIKAKLRELGGRWNKWEKGWEYPASDLERITAALTPERQENTTPAEIADGTPSSEATAPEQTTAVMTVNREEEAPAPKGAAEQMEAAATKLLTMAADHRQAMEEKRADIAEEVRKTQEFFRESGPTIQQKRIEGDARKAGRSNTSLAAPQMFLF